MSATKRITAISDSPSPISPQSTHYRSSYIWVCLKQVTSKSTGQSLSSLWTCIFLEYCIPPHCHCHCHCHTHTHPRTHARTHAHTHTHRWHLCKLIVIFLNIDLFIFMSSRHLKNLMRIFINLHNLSKFWPTYWFRGWSRPSLRLSQKTLEAQEAGSRRWTWWWKKHKGVWPVKMITQPTWKTYEI